MNKANATRSEEQPVSDPEERPRWNDLYDVHIRIMAGLDALNTFCRQIDRTRRGERERRLLSKSAIAERFKVLRRDLERQLELMEVPFGEVSAEFALTRTDTAKACGREAISAHAIALWLVRTLAEPQMIGPRIPNNLELVCSLNRNELNSLHGQVALEWMKAASARLTRGGRPITRRELTSGFPDEPGVSEEPMTGAEEAPVKPIRTRRGKGGRPRKWVELVELNVEMKESDPEVSRKKVCAAFNQRYSRAISSGQKSKATPAILSRVVYDYTHRKRAQTHE